MKSHILLLIIGITSLFYSCDKNKQLTQQQKINDFLYLYEAMEDNYPYFGVAKRKSDIDWLNKKDEYIERIRKTSSDSAYLYALINILSELRDGHTDLSPVPMWEDFLEGYKEASEEMPQYKVWAETVEESVPCISYWSDIMLQNSTKANSNDANSTDIYKEISHYKDSIIHDKSIAIMQIPSISMELIPVDKVKIDEFMNKISGMDNLIIDIQGNGGGATKYWSDLIVSRLIKDTVIFNHYYAIKDGKLNRKFYSEDFTTKKRIKKENPFYSKIHPDFLSEQYYFIEEPEVIAAKNPINFKGNIYLLVDEGVFSSAEGFTYFSKNTGWAKVAGQPTKGDGVGSDPILILLPESNIIARIPVTAGFNADGNINTETGTAPDIIVDGKTKEERLQNLIVLLLTKQK